MNLRVFLKEVDEISTNLSHEKLEGFVHEIARTLPEEKRDNFIKILRLFGGSSDKAAAGKLSNDGGCSELLTNIARIKDKLIEINQSIRMLDSTYNEEWDDWYNSDVDEILFMDPQGIIGNIETAMELIHTCIDMEVYKEGSQLAELLSVLEVSAKGDYNDCDGSPLYLYDLSVRNLLSSDFKKCVKECLYLTYMANSLEDRADELFCMIGNFQCYDIKLEEILQSGNMELPDIHEFLLQWIDYLGNQKGRYVEKLLKEAQHMIQDDDILVENARRYVKDHPFLYEELLCMKHDSGKDEEMFHLGIEALDKIPVTYLVRSDIALLTAEYACKLKNYAAVENCWMEAFRSNTTVVNYLRIRFQSGKWNCYESEVKSIYEQTYKTKHDQHYVYSENIYEKNALHTNEYFMMLFFDEQFDKILNTGMSEKNALGWSSTFMKQGLALFLLLLFKGKELPVGLLSMLNRVVSACAFEVEEYGKGTEERYSETKQELFWKLFCQWKDNVQLPESKRIKWLNKIEQWIQFRVQGIMENNRRNYYGECASFIAAYGEVQESLGCVAAKSRIMGKYKSEYSRRRAFHQELRTYGMR